MESADQTAAQVARWMWTLCEPVHVVTYFSAEARSAFEDAGLKLTSFNVDLAGGFASFQQQQQQQSSQQGTHNGRPLLLGGVDTTETDENSLVAAPNFGPPVLAGTSWSALNYLV